MLKENCRYGNRKVKTFLLTEGRDTATYAATMETKDSVVVQALFKDVYDPVRTVYAKPTAFDTDTSNHFVARLNASGGINIKTGPSLILKVMAGDKVQASVYSYYATPVQPPPGGVSLLADILAVLGQGVVNNSGGHLAAGDLTGVNNALNPNVLSFLNTGRSYDVTKPKAYLNWILFDDQFNYVASNSGVQQVQPGTSAQVLSAPLQTISKNGYLYVYVSNESQQDVYFDKLTVKHYTGPLSQEQSYYPFGLQMAGISDKALLKQTNPYKFNGGTELEEDGGLNYYNTFYRKYDPQTGRFTGVDMLAEKYSALNPYQFAANNPILFNDVTGAKFTHKIPTHASGNSRSLDDYMIIDPGMLYEDSGGGGGGGDGSGGGGVTFTGSSAQVILKALQDGYASLGDGSMVDLLLIGGADLNGTGLSHESLEILKEVSANVNLNVTALDPTYFSDDVDNMVHGAAENLYDSYQQGDKIFIYGYSLGGNYALQIARELNNTNTPVSLLITVDAAFGPFSSSVDRTVTPNVLVNYNIYQTNWSKPLLSHGDPNIADNPQTTTIYNVNVTGQTFYDTYSHQTETINHQNIDQYSLSTVVSLIKYYANH